MKDAKRMTHQKISKFERDKMKYSILYSNVLKLFTLLSAVGIVINAVVSGNKKSKEGVEKKVQVTQLKSESWISFFYYSSSERCFIAYLFPKFGELSNFRQDVFAYTVVPFVALLLIFLVHFFNM